MVGALLTAALITGCQTSTTADEEALRETIEAWDAAYNSRDADAMAAQYAEDALRMNANEAALRGREAIRAGFVEEWESGLWGSDTQGVLRDVHMSGDLAMARGTWTATNNPTDEEPFQDHGNWMTLYRRSANGSWKMVWDIWNSSSPPRPPE